MKQPHYFLPMLGNYSVTTLKMRSDAYVLVRWHDSSMIEGDSVMESPYIASHQSEGI